MLLQAFRCAAIVLSLGLLLTQSQSHATDPGSRAMSDRIDELLIQKLTAESARPADLCDDATFLRRVSLDLAGRNPAAAEVIGFIKDTDENKRAKLIERLLSSPASSTHLATTWSSWLLPETSEPDFFNTRSGLTNWLRTRFSDNLRYDRLVADLLVSSGSASTGPGVFFASLEGKPEKIAAKTARVFLGVQLDCAECHNHPFDHWTQRDFWGFAAYFARVSADPARAPGMAVEVADRAEGEVSLPGSEEVIAPKPLVESGLSGLDSGTRRQQLTLWLTARENPYLARAAVNRCWNVLFGRGLIEPIDDMRSLEIASHPELLDELSKYFAKTGFDLRNLLRTIANTKAYQRANRIGNGSVVDGSYAAMPVKPLTATQMSTCLQMVARSMAPSAPNQADALAAQLGKLRGDAGRASLGIVQALVTLHSAQMTPIYRENQSRLLDALSAPHLNQEQQIEWMFLCTLCRKPSAHEIESIQATIAKPAEKSPSTETKSDEEQEKKSDSNTWQSDLLWALINSTEFAMTP